MATKRELEQRVINAALQWWRSCRPVGWTIRMHLAAPDVNTATHSDANLASVIAALAAHKKGAKRNG